MDTVSDRYEDVATAYIRLVRLENKEAGAALELISAAFGAHAALRAALIIMNLKMEVQHNHWIPSIGLYAHLLEDYPDALPLAKYAMNCYLARWNVTLDATGEWEALNRA